MKNKIKKYISKKGMVMNNKKALASLGLAFLMLCSGCASEVENLDVIDTVNTQTEQTAQTVYTEDSTVQTDNTTVTGSTTSPAEEITSGESTTAATVSAVESATTPITIVTGPSENQTSTSTNTPSKTTSTANVTTTTTTAATTTTTTAATTAATTAVTTITTTVTTEVTTTVTTEATTEVTTEATTEVTTAGTTQGEDDPISSKYNDKMTTAEVVKNMGIGINLGNTFEACNIPQDLIDMIIEWKGKLEVSDYETLWGSPIITKEMIEGYAKCGFGALRIPVAWSNLMSEDYTISNELMDRIKEVTQWTLDSGMYAIVNIHWDGGWWEKFPEDKAECMKKYTRIWEQISEGFKDFDGRVIFESLNEEGGSWESLWNRYTGVGDKKASYDLLNEINQKFVDIVRASGGKNEIRHLLIAGFCTDIGQTCDEFYKMPNDPKNRCAVSVHYYTPAPFANIDEDAPWAPANPIWGNEAEKKELADNMNMMKTHFADKGIPVIIGEFGVAPKNKTPEMIRLYMSSVAKAAVECGLCPVVWDITDHFYDRKNCKFYDDELLKGIMAATN